MFKYSKKPEEMTFQEFFDLVRDEELKQQILTLLKKEGFTEKQVNKMKMEEVNLYMSRQLKTLLDVELEKTTKKQKETPSKPIKLADFENMLQEIKTLRKKYNMPKGVLFVPNKLEFSIQRISYDNFHLSYKEFFNYIPDELLDVVIFMTINFLVQLGMPREWINRTDRNCVGIEVDGNFFRVVGSIIPELMIQKRLKDSEISSFLSFVARTRKALTDFSELEFEWNSETWKKFNDKLNDQNRIMQEHPSIKSELEAIMKKYTQQSEKLKSNDND